MLKTDTPSGPVWHRYNGDGYGEHNDGSAFDGTGRGRGWPLLVGERGHHALLAGEDPLLYLDTMAAMSGSAYLLPEQVWDWKPMPEHRLEPGKPSGSAMPLVWAHMPNSSSCVTAAHWVIRSTGPWPLGTATRASARRFRMASGARAIGRAACSPGNQFTIALSAPAQVHWGINGWQTVRDSDTLDTGLGVYIVDLPLTSLGAGESVQFTFFWPEQNRWEGRDYEVRITA